MNKDIWCLIFKHLHFHDFLNTMLVEKAAYSGFKMHSSPTLILYESKCPSKCQLCFEKTTLKNRDLTSPCCGLILCPKCPVDKPNETIFHYMFIKSVIYIQCEYEEKETLPRRENYREKWVTSKQLLNSDDYEYTDDKYNSYTRNKMYIKRDRALYWNSRGQFCYNNEGVELELNIYAKCVCKKCRFECNVRGYFF